MEHIVGRIPEQKQLARLLESPEAELLALYGRRRVGKTFLIRNAYEKQLVFEFSGVHQASLKKQLELFAKALSQASRLPIATPKSWTEAFDQLIAFLEPKIKKQKKVIFIDEFPWLHTPRSGFREAFAQFWNMWASRQKNLVVVICGSAAAWMITHIINNRGGLHNRVTCTMRLLPFTLAESEAFLKSRHILLDRYQLVQLYMVMGGVPQYLKTVDRADSVTTAVDRICFSPDGFLHHEFKNLFQSLFESSQNHMAVVKALAKSRGGLTRNELIKACGLQTGGGTTQLLDELRESGFIEAYTPFGKTSKDSVFKLIDEFSLFYFKFMADQKIHGPGSWMRFSSSASWTVWCGLAFEQLCLKHVAQIKHGLGISGVFSEHYLWRHASPGEEGAQIDLLIDRHDQCINVCEMKFSRDEFEVTTKYAKDLERKLRVFQSSSGTKKSLFLTMVTTHGLKNSMNYRGLIQAEVTMDALFHTVN